MSDSNRLIIFDTTLRDGEQAAGAAMTVEEKLEIAQQLEKLGVDVIEAGFPYASQGDLRAVTLIAEKVRGTCIAALARANPKDIDAAWEALKGAEEPRIHTFIGTSEIHRLHQLRKDREEVMELACAMVRRAKGYCSNVEFSPMDATRTEPEYLFQLLKAVIDQGATTINIPDTVGYAMPHTFAALIKAIMENVPNIHKAVVSVHCHNDLGLSTANSLEAVSAGVRQVECTINGLGERAGNASLEEVVMGVHTRKDLFGLTTNINTREIYRTSRLVSDITGFVVQPNKAVVGANAFRHASGIHQDAVLKERTTFEIMDPVAIGWPGSALVLGKLSGHAGLRKRLQDLGYNLESEEMNKAFVAFKELADKKREVTDKDLEALMADQRRTTGTTETYRLDHVQVSCGDHDVPTATVRLLTPEGQAITDAATGAGPVDAVYKAINRIVQVPNTLTEFSVRPVTEGIDAIGEVTIRIDSRGKSFVGRGASTDIIVAGAKAYMNALNRLLSIQGRP
ncbi:MAG: 2-isopropylmalate synthase [Chloroflexi bacterium]|nr:2-isopropylmalate synthase [Chloroflexota bacterium]